MSMTIEQYMNRLFRDYPQAARERVEADPFYQEAYKSGDTDRAAMLAIEILEGKAQTRAGGRRVRKESRELERLWEDLGLLQ